MKEKLHFIKIEATGFQDLCNHIRDLEEKTKLLENENQQLTKENTILSGELAYFKEYAADLEDKVNRKNRMLNGVKLNNSKLTIERNRLQSELDNIKLMSMFEFGNSYCSNETLESDGRAFAKALLGGD